MSLCRINDQDYMVAIQLFNTDNDSTDIPWSVVTELNINDNLLRWYDTGYITYRSNDEGFERIPNSKEVIQSDISLPALVKSEMLERRYRFRNDGRDFLHIYIKPIHETVSDQTKDINLDPEWTIQQTFVVYDKEDLPAPDNIDKLRRLYFYDADYLKLQETRLQWSSATSLRNPSGTSKSSFRTSDASREMPTGLMIMDILISCGMSVDVENFDAGASKLFFSCVGNMSAMDCVDYLLGEHLSATNNDTCLLTKDRTTGMFKLLPIAHYMSKAGKSADAPGEWQIESLTLNSPTLPPPAIPKLKAPITQVMSTKVDVKIDQVRQYQYTDASPEMVSKILAPRIINTHENGSKSFVVNTQNSTIDRVLDHLKTVYIEPNLMSTGGGHPLLLNNTPKRELTNRQQMYTPRSTPESIKKAGLGTLSRFAIFLMGVMQIDLLGHPFRRSGRFFGLHRTAYNENCFDYKFTGQWLITEVTHILKQNAYTQKITGVKAHSYDSVRLSNDSM